jgi:hypothetical protein
MELLSTIVVQNKPDWLDWCTLGASCISFLALIVSIFTVRQMIKTNGFYKDSIALQGVLMNAQIEAFEAQKKSSEDELKAIKIGLIDSRLDRIKSNVVYQNLNYSQLVQGLFLYRTGSFTTDELREHAKDLIVDQSNPFFILLENYGHLAALCNSVCDPYQYEIARRTYEDLHKYYLEEVAAEFRHCDDCGLPIPVGKLFNEKLDTFLQDMALGEDKTINLNANRLF